MMFTKKESLNFLSIDIESIKFNIRQYISTLMQEELKRFQYNAYQKTFSSEYADYAEGVLIASACREIKSQVFEDLKSMNLLGSVSISVEYSYKLGVIDIKISYFSEEYRITLYDTYHGMLNG